MKKQSKKMKGEPTNKQIFDALIDFRRSTDKKFEGIDKQFNGVYGALVDLHQATANRFGKVDEELHEIRVQLNRIESVVLHDHERRLEALEKKVFARS